MNSTHNNTAVDRPQLLIGGKGFLGTAYSGFLNSRKISFRSILKGEKLSSSSDATDQPPVIVDFAYTSLPNTSYTDPVKDFSENLYNVIKHLDFARSLPDATFVYISSGGTVYGNSGGIPVAEGYRNIPLSPYGITKLACEKYVLMYKEVYGLDIRIVRPSNVYGPGQKPFRGQGLVATALATVLLNKPFQIFGDGSSVRDYLYIDDFCSGLHDIITFGVSGEVYNMGSGAGYSILNIVEQIVHLNDGKSGGLAYLPSRPFDVTFNVLDSSRVRELNGWTPEINMKDGFSITMDWMKDYLKSDFML